MDTMRRLATALTLWDWLAVVAFFVAWIGYARFARRRAAVQPTLLAASNQVRRQWMLQATRREVRVVDGVVVACSRCWARATMPARWWPRSRSPRARRRCCST
jgi:hypothetical protein